ncbi:MAG TPA: HoxN/HupN/NixA family nickel/cobalt transporter [Conexibacter sp.]|jgi:high-affinity nickel-transport protein|nr:HoxN/HupN/NixA family nickel/cobalt transporter [Conexibacter sp.]
MHAPSPAAATAGSRWSRVKASLTPAEWRRVALMLGFVACLHLLGFLILLVLVVPRDLSLGSSGAFGLGVGVTAYTFGLRHAFDADHVAAIDNTTRKLMGDGQRPLSAGFFFSLGHSTIVFALALLLAFGLRALGGQVANHGSTLHDVTGLVGTLVSGTFLLLIGLLNLVLLAGIVRVFRRMRDGQLDEAELEARLEQRGAMNRFYARFTKAVTKPWQMYPIGMLFGLGFDTATEVALLLLAAGAAFGGLPSYAIVCLPILFAAGMSLLDTLDGAFMSFAYGWAFTRPVRKIYYNLTITGLSVAITLVIGTIELASAIAHRLDLSGGVWSFVAGVDLNLVGFFVVGLLFTTWVVALLVWRYGRIEERWTGALRADPAAPVDRAVDAPGRHRG